MKNITVNILVVSLILPTFLGLVPTDVFADDLSSDLDSSYVENYDSDTEDVEDNDDGNSREDKDEDEYKYKDSDDSDDSDKDTHPKNCVNGQSLNVNEFGVAYTSGLISFSLATNTTNSLATFTIKNSTGCTAPISLSAYKMYDTTLSHQELYSGTGLVYATSSTSINVELPGCMAQIDAWYGLYPEILLDSNPYGYPNVPFVLAYKFLYNNKGGYHNAEGNFCVKEVNQAPVITLVGQNPFSVTLGNTYTDAGATALDNEDGNITANIIVTSNVNTNVVGTYKVKYNVIDSGGLSAVKVIRIVEVVPAPVELKVATVSATKIVCDSETDLPNYGAGGPDIGSQTATAFVASHPNCKIVPWIFEWVKAGNSSSNPGDQVSVGGGNWMPFNSTSIIPVGEKIWVREQFVDGYIPFTGLNTAQTISAELYCHTDVLNYDNYDWVNPVVKNNTYYCVAWNVLKTPTPPTPVNHPPVITLVGANPASVNVGGVFIDPGATAQDQEDGNITANIIVTSTVNTTIAGTYVVTYNVKDSEGLEAVEVSRTVNVLEIHPTPKGKITFCLLLADTENVLATTSAGLPQGVFSIKLATSTNIASTTIQTKVWNSESFAPNKMAILNINDSDCVTFDNLPYGIYNYSTLGINGSSWNTAMYNDQYTQPVNNIFDFFNFSDTNTNSDGYIIIGSHRSERTLYVLSKYNPAPQCTLPVITSPITASITVGNPFTYTLTASSTTDILTVSTTTLPSWLSFATTTNILSGTPTVVGTYNVELKSTNTCGFDVKTLVISVVAGGGGGGGSSPSSDLEVVKTSDKSTASVGDTITYTITLVNKGPSDASTTVTDLIPSTLTFVSSTSTLGSFATTTGVWTVGNLVNNATTTLTIVAKVNTGTEGQKITNTAVVTSNQTDPNTTNNTSSKDININPAPTTGGGCTSNCGSGGGGGGGGNGPIVGSFGGGNNPIVAPTVPTTPVAPNSCYYLYDYLRKDFSNNPVEVKKLQVFLRDIEGFTTVQVTGVYDDQTIVALDSFQDRYKGDILTPWGHTEATSYTYILTKKKVNEIYCKMAFPVNTQQQSEIDSYKAFLQGLRDAGININGGVPVNTPSNPSNGVNGQVGIKPTVKNSNEAQTTLAGVSSTTEKFLSGLTANVISSAKGFMNSLLGFFGLASTSATEKANQCINAFVGLGWLNWILILIILVISYLWYREYRSNKKIEEINKEIDLK